MLFKVGFNAKGSAMPMELVCPSPFTATGAEMSVFSGIRWCVMCVLLIASQFALFTNAHAQKRVALVIGNNAYVDPQKLSNPVNDALLVGNVLEQNLGFDVVRRTDLNRTGMFDAIQEISEKGKGADVVVVYYSGHGVQGPGGNFLLPTDANIGAYEHIRRDALPVNDIVDALQSTGARVALLILDACRDYAYGNKSSSKGLVRMENVSGNLLVAYATQEGATATEGRGKNSPYARALADHLQRTTVPLLEVLDEVAETVKQETLNRQRPTRYGDMKVRTCLIEGRCVAGSTIAANGASGHPAPQNANLGDIEFWNQIQAKTELHHFLEYQIKYPSGKFIEVARKKAGVALRSKSGCALREITLPLDVEFDWNGKCREGLADGFGTKTYYRAGIKMREWVGMFNRGIPAGTWKGTSFGDSPSEKKSVSISFVAGGNISPVQAFTLNNGTTYEGETDASLASQIGNPNGKGRMHFPNGELYEGDWERSQRTGQGVLIFPKSTLPDAAVKYTGEFKDGAFSGFGTMLRVSGASYAGTWINGRRNGRGKLVFADGGTYEGDFVDDRRTGRGILTFAKKPAPEAPVTYAGEFREDMFHGEGTMSFNSGASYVGHWLSGKRHGHGRYSAPSGEVYDGEWAGDQRSGRGTHVLAKTSNPGALISYMGDFRDNVPNGRGTMIWANGAQYIGNVQNARPHGYGELKRPDGTVAKGLFDQSRNVADGPVQ